MIKNERKKNRRGGEEEVSSLCELKSKLCDGDGACTNLINNCATVDDLVELLVQIAKSKQSQNDTGQIVDAMVVKISNGEFKSYEHLKTSAQRDNLKKDILRRNIVPMDRIYNDLITIDPNKNDDALKLVGYLRSYIENMCKCLIYREQKQSCDAHYKDQCDRGNKFACHEKYWCERADAACDAGRTEPIALKPDPPPPPPPAPKPPTPPAKPALPPIKKCAEESKNAWRAEIAKLQALATSGK
jgi:hypothetical protein